MAILHKIVLSVMHFSFSRATRKTSTAIRYCSSVCSAHKKPILDKYLAKM